ncbi:POK9 protein, partial [Agelaius phoeniceus]|nr:POK9 protein [Agelaius phoeniceus]
KKSLSIDLATAINVTLIDNKPQKIPTRVKKPITINNQPEEALLLGRSSSELKRDFVLPSLIDRDYERKISIVVQTHFLPMHIPKGSKIAQLVPMQQLTNAATASSPYDRRNKKFESTRVLTLLTVPISHRPIVTAILQ